MGDDKPCDVDHKGDSGKENHAPAKNAEPLIVTIEPQTKNKYSYEAKHYRLDHARFRLEKKTYCTSHWTMIFLILYTGLTLIVATSSVVATWFSIEQAKLMRQQLVGTQAAIITLNGVPAWDSTKQQFRLHIVNIGGINGVITHFTATVQREHLPEQIPIGQPFPIEFSNREITRTQDYWLEKGLPWPLPKVEDQRFWPGNEMTIMKGRYSYANGFGDTISHDFCFVWMAPWNLNVPNSSRYPNGAGWSGGQWTGGMDDGCPTVEELKVQFFGFKEKYDEMMAPQH